MTVEYLKSKDIQGNDSVTDKIFLVYKFIYTPIDLIITAMGKMIEK